MADMQSELGKIAREIEDNLAGEPGEEEQHAAQKGRVQNRGQQAGSENDVVEEGSDELLEAGEEDELPEAGEEEVTQGEADEGEGAPGITDINGLAKAIEVDIDYLYDLDIPMPSGQPAVKLGKIKDELTEARRRLADAERQMAQPPVPPAEQPQLSDEMRAAQNKIIALESRYAEVDWDNAEADKGELAYYRQRLIEEYGAAQKTYQEAERKQLQQQAQSMQQLRQQELGRLFEKVPEYKDEKVLAADRQAILEAVKEYGFGESDLNGIIDHRVVMMLRDLARARKAAKTKAVRTAPKVLRPGSGKKMAGGEKIDALIQRARNSAPSVRRVNEIEAAKAILRGAK